MSPSQMSNVTIQIIFLILSYKLRLYHSPWRFSFALGSYTSDTCPTSISALVVEGRPLQSFPADFPIYKLFNHAHRHISFFCFGVIALREFQHIRRNTLQCFQMQRTGNISMLIVNIHEIISPLHIILKYITKQLNQH